MSAFPLPAQNALDMQPPVAALAAPLSAQRIAATDQNGASHTTALTVGQYASLLVGANAVRFRVASTEALAASTAATDPIIGAYQRFDWLVSSTSAFIGIAASSGTAEAHVWTSSGTR